MNNVSNNGTVQNQYRTQPHSKKPAKWEVRNNKNGKKTEQADITLLEKKTNALNIKHLSENEKLPRELKTEKILPITAKTALQSTFEKSEKITALGFKNLSNSVDLLAKDISKTAADYYATQDDLSKQFNEFDQKYTVSINMYKYLNNALQELETSIANASNEPVNEEVEKQLTSCKEISKSLNADSVNLKETLKKLATDLDSLDHRIVKLKMNTWNLWGAYLGEKTRALDFQNAETAAKAI